MGIASAIFCSSGSSAATVFLWQILESKQRFISQFLSGSAYQRKAPDLEENVLNYAEVKALAFADPGIKNLDQNERATG